MFALPRIVIKLMYVFIETTNTLASLWVYSKLLCDE